MDKYFNDNIINLYMGCVCTQNYKLNIFDACYVSCNGVLRIINLISPILLQCNGLQLVTNKKNNTS